MKFKILIVALTLVGSNTTGTSHNKNIAKLSQPMNKLAHSPIVAASCGE